LAGSTCTLASALAGVRAGSSSGSVTIKVAPPISPGLSTFTVPPCSSIRWRTMSSPSPRPPCARVALASAWRTRSKACGGTGGGAHGVDGGLDDRAEADRPHVETELAPDGARHVQQVVDDAQERAHALLHRVAGALDGGSVEPAAPQHPHPGEHAGEGRAQLV